MSALHTVGRFGRELGRLVLDRVPSGSALPARAAELDPLTLGAIIGSPVTSCTPVAGTSGTTDRAVLRLTGPGPGLPATVFAKTAATAAGTRFFGGLARLGEVEVGFYRDLRSGLDLEAPQILGSRFDPRTGRFAIVLEDLAARGAQFIDVLTPLTVDRAAAGLSTLARLHGATAFRDDLPRWMTTNSGDAVMPVVTALLGRLGRAVAERDPSLTAPGGAGLLSSYGRWARELDRDAFCVLHGDPHPGNLYLLGDRVGLLDWQVVRRGHGLRDATYLMVLGLETPDRRTAERDLLAHYCAELAAYGGPRISPPEAWEGYRRMAAYVYVSGTFTSGLGGMQGAAIADAGLRRSVAAVEDLETVRAF